MKKEKKGKIKNLKFIRNITIKDNNSGHTKCDEIKYIDTIKTLLCLFDNKIICLKIPELTKNLEYQEILNWHETPVFLSYQENTNRLYVKYNNLKKDEPGFTSVYTFKGNKISISGFINFQINDVIDVSDNKLIILDQDFCKCLTFINNEYKIIKKLDEKFSSIQLSPKKDKFIGVTNKNLLVIDINTFQKITVINKQFNSSFCFLNNKYLVTRLINTFFIEIYDLKTFKMLCQETKKHYLNDSMVKAYSFGKSGYFIYNRFKDFGHYETIITEFKNNKIEDLNCLNKVSLFGKFTYSDDFLFFEEDTTIKIYKIETEKNDDIEKKNCIK